MFNSFQNISEFSAESRPTSARPGPAQRAARAARGLAAREAREVRAAGEGQGGQAAKAPKAFGSSTPPP